MRIQAPSTPLTFLLAALLSVTVASGAMASSSRTAPARELPRELPSKSTKPRVERLAIPPQYNAVVVKNSSQAELGGALEKSETKLEEVTVISRKTVPAPEGDLAELLPEKVQTGSALPAKALAPSKAPLTPKAVAPISASLLAKTVAPIAPDKAPPPETSTNLFVGPLPEIPRQDGKTAVGSEGAIVEPNVGSSVERSAGTSAKADSSSTTTPNTSTIAFLRTGYLKSHASEFDPRMKDGATSIGLGAARGVVTDLGVFEARASIDVYHAIDQSVSIATARMVSTRTEATYWFSGARVKPGLSLALGWAEYSVRSYHHSASASELTVRTHAESQAFTIIPGTALRIGLGEGLMIDFQTEYMALLGGDSAANVQGLGASLALGWLF